MSGNRPRRGSKLDRIQPPGQRSDAVTRARKPGELLGNVCERCGIDAGAESVFLEAATIAQYLYDLMLCGPCWSMLRTAIELELAGGGPGGHRELGRGLHGQAGELGDYATGSPPLGELHPTD